MNTISFLKKVGKWALIYWPVSIILVSVSLIPVFDLFSVGSFNNIFFNSTIILILITMYVILYVPFYLIALWGAMFRYRPIKIAYIPIITIIGFILFLLAMSIAPDTKDFIWEFLIS